MGSVKRSPTGREHHWTDEIQRGVPYRIGRGVKQQQSLAGQLPLFTEKDIAHLDAGAWWKRKGFKAPKTPE